MRLFPIALVSLAFTGVAIAQDIGFTIEDDVSRENAVRCAALRTALAEADSRARGSRLVALGVLELAWKSYLRSQPQYGDQAQLQRDVAAEIAKHAGSSVPALTAMSDECEPFEIRSAPPAGG